MGREVQQKGQRGGEGTGTAEGLGSAGAGKGWISLQDPLHPGVTSGAALGQPFCTGESLLQGLS